MFKEVCQDLSTTSVVGTKPYNHRTTYKQTKARSTDTSFNSCDFYLQIRRLYKQDQAHCRPNIDYLNLAVTLYRLFLTCVNLGSNPRQVDAMRGAHGCRLLCSAGFMSFQRFAYLGQWSKNSYKSRKGSKHNQVRISSLTRHRMRII